MSDSSPDIAGLIAEATELQWANCVIVAGTALILYEYFLTFSTEISEIWKSKFTGARALFCLTRYFYLFYVVFNCATSFSPIASKTLCRAVIYIGHPWSIIPLIGLYGILTLRTFAIYQKNWFIFVILAGTGAANVAVIICVIVLGTPDIGSGAFGTFCGTDLVPSIPRLELASTIISLVFDVLVFTMTFAKTIRHVLDMRKAGLGYGLGYFILRDGTMYFLAKLVLGVVATTLFIVPASDVIGTWVIVISALNNPLTIVLINRLVLNLRQVSHLQEIQAPTFSAISTIQEPEFATNSLLGNLGAPLRMGPDDDEIEELGVDDVAEVVKGYGIVDHGGIIEEPRGPSDV